MGIETLTRGAKRSYEEFKAQQPNGIDKLFFPIEDLDTSSAFAMDRFIESPHGIVYRDKDNQSHVLPYQAGTGYVYDVPRASEKTPVGEELRDAKITGLEATDSQAVHYRKLLDDIVKQHVSSHNMTKWKQAIDVIFDGEFYAKGDAGLDINLDIDFSRDSDNELTHDFTATDTQPIALKEMQDQLKEQDSPMTNLVCLMGDDWLNDWSTDSDVLTYLDANSSNPLLQQQLVPPLLRGAHGLTVVGTYRAPGMIAPVWICTFSPGVQYKAYKGASASDWITATKAAMFSLDSPRYRIYRGVDAFNEAGRSQRLAGELVFDTYHENDPVTDFMRSQTRHCYIPGNINHTVVSTGTFS